MTKPLDPETKLARKRAPLYRNIEPVPSLPAEEPWMRLVQETFQSYEGFVIYRELGPERTLTAAEHLYRTRKNQKVPKKGQRSGQFSIWLKRFRWKERAQAYDRHMDALDVATLRKKRVQVLKRQADENAQISEVLMTPIRMFKERLDKFVSGELKNSLDDLTEEDLLRLGRHTAQVLSSIHKNEREVLGVKDDADVPQVDLTIRAEAVRAAMQSPDTIAMLERFSAEVTTRVSEGNKPAAVLPEPDGDELAEGTA